MVMGVDLLNQKEKKWVAETPIFDALVMTEPFAGTEKYMRIYFADVDDFHRKFYWRSIRGGTEHPNPVFTWRR